MPLFHHRSHFPFPSEEVFAWHKRPGAFERLSPPWVRVRVLKREGGMHDGGRVVLAIKQGPAEMELELRHTAFEEGRLFRDEQVSGPFEKWIHSHRFIPADDGGCFLEDEIEWTPPMGSAGRLFAEGFIEKALVRAFSFRHSRLRNDLTLHGSYGGKRLTVALTGGSGLIGSTLKDFLPSGGHEVLALSRRREGSTGTGPSWDPIGDRMDPAVLEGVDAVVHLAGESLAAFRWTEGKKEEILKSRRDGTALIARTLAGMARPPQLFVSASAVGYYGNRGDEILAEDSGPGTGFLAMVCREWEGATGVARKAGIRVVNLRTGFVISPLGPGLGKMLPPFKAGLGGRIGSGRQYLSWIDLDDHIGLIHHALTRPGVSGPLNATAPNPVPNSTFTDALGRVLGRPTLVPLPAFAVKGILGE
ncbi:MAG: TIGR01777 family oxidoreductase, partial [Longimicrobiales bacterium]|nr:TIGR01777 family oxidoreductase [Longimicrobiales bacterium]